MGFRSSPLLLLLALGACCAATGSSTSTGGGSSGGGAGTSGGVGDGGGMTCSGPYGTVTCPVGEYCTTAEPTCFPISPTASGGSTGTQFMSTTGGRGTSGGTSGGRLPTGTGGTGTSVPYSGSTGGTEPYTSGWPKWHRDNTDQGLSQSDTSSNQGTLVWKASVGVPQVGPGNIGLVNPNPSYLNSPVVDPAGNVYQLGMDGTFYAFGDGGTKLWSETLLPPNPDAHAATPIIAGDNTLYVETGSDTLGTTTTAAQLYHLDAATGKILFQAGPPVCPTTCFQAADGFDVSPSLGRDGLLFDGDDFGQTVTFTLAAGGSFTQGNFVLLPFYGERVAVALDPGDNSYWCSANVCFGVTSPTAGFKAMSAWPALGAPIGGAPGNNSAWTNSDLAYDQSHTGWLMVEAGTQITSSGFTEVVAMDPSNGSLHWDVRLPSGPTPLTVNAVTESGYLSADVGNSSPAIGADGTVYAGNVDGLYAFNGATGAIKTGFPYKPSQDTGSGVDVDTAVAIGGDGTIFFATAGGTFYAIKPDGTERFHYKTGGRISCSPAIGPDGTVFFVSDDGFLYAIR